ncbi:polymer-forming cytoskeletal protein [Enterobacteriaceae bacterium H20N1]|uniref:Polymer-forming cytoskeletal protein n=1 Tax=Dryocola boscaweniae TaxID=2925397 RepID=A0A9X3ANX7_9ENTR|nr:polymer-forming cytoskeletal protein [Dryocola boscaweniae]MCT4703357.1 polymer-forming cytoskeletal protein [Dryocola boscaweniae]MCT4720525.1 polymer-forming cytoskeletal protein [Dryocola boscaweniae]
MLITVVSLFPVVLLRQIKIKQGKNMFKKKNQELVGNNMSTNALTEHSAPAAESDKHVAPQSARRCTVVAQGTLFTGNINLEGDIHVYGKILGNINLTNGILHVMRDGFIEGEFTAPNIIINGNVQGTCIGEKIEILEHGEMNGLSRSAAFSIRPGGCFIGHSERLPEAQREKEPEHIFKMKKNQQDMAVEDATVIALVQGE